MAFKDIDYIPLNNQDYKRKSKTSDIIKKLINIGVAIYIIFNLYTSYISAYISTDTNEVDNPNLKDFEYVIPNEKNGPITVNRNEDDGTKLNIFSMINDNENNTIYYDEDEFEKLDMIVNVEPKYLCEYNEKLPTESFEGYYLTCPNHYTISIKNTFYGRYQGDLERCNKFHDGRNVTLKELTVKETCGVEPLDTLKELCDGKKKCHVIPCNAYFGAVCKRTYKYLYVDYYCKRDIEIKKPRIMINMFSNSVGVNSVYENAISEFYQYAKYHGYEFVINRNRYDSEREIFYMKINTIIENLIKCLQEKSHDWIFWVDSDVILANPNIKLETFLPNEKMDLIHFIASDDRNGLNCGVFFIRVHPWSLNFLMRSTSYFYYHQEKFLTWADQSSMNNVLTGSNDTDEHYVIVPQHWFNRYFHNKKKGEFLVHLAGKRSKTEKARIFRSEIRNDSDWYTAITNRDLRKQVLEYYDLPKEKQHRISIQ